MTAFKSLINMKSSTHKMAGSLYSVLLLLCGAAVGFTNILPTQTQEAQGNLIKLARANNKLAINIFHLLADSSSENYFYSPLSLSTVWGMLYYGTKGNAAEELKDILGYERAGFEDGVVHQIFQYYLTEILPSQDPSAYILHSANAILLNKNLNLVPSYREDIQDLYQAPVESVDFATEATQINNWVNEKTNGKIEKLVDNVDPSALLVLLNAVYFKGTWETEFNPDLTRPQTFYNDGLESEAKQVEMMSLEKQFLYTYDSSLQAHAIELPYKGENITMVILLPVERDGLESMEKDLTLSKMASIKHRMGKSNIRLIFPKFKIQYSRDMTSDFKTLGAKTIFTPEADISGITSAPNVFVTQVLHKAVIEVNEEGSEAAAVSAVAFTRSNFMFKVDHPFIFNIMDKRNDMILFVGRVTSL